MLLWMFILMACPRFPLATMWLSLFSTAACNANSVGEEIPIYVLASCTGEAPACSGRSAGLAEYAVVLTWKLFALPENLSFDEIALCEPVACVIHSIRRANLQFGDEVLVLGGGTMGQLHLLLARLRGARVFLSDPDPEKRQLALENGACEVFEPGDTAAGIQKLTGGIGADAIFVTFGNQDTADQASASVSPGGRVIYYSSFPEDVSTNLSPRRLHNQEVCTGWRQRPDDRRLESGNPPSG